MTFHGIRIIYFNLILQEPVQGSIYCKIEKRERERESHKQREGEGVCLEVAGPTWIGVLQKIKLRPTWQGADKDRVHQMDTPVGK